MPNIKPISDLRNYSEVLQEVAIGAPVFAGSLWRPWRNISGSHMNNLHLSEEAQADLAGIKEYISKELENPASALSSTQNHKGAAYPVRRFVKSSYPHSCGLMPYFCITLLHIIFPMLNCQKSNNLILKSKGVVLRSPELSDSRESLEYLVRCAAETTYVGRYPEEIKTTLEKENSYILKPLRKRGALHENIVLIRQNRKNSWEMYIMNKKRKNFYKNYVLKKEIKML